MIYIATVHWRTDKWIDIQLRYLKKFIPEGFRVFASFTDISEEHTRKYYHSTQEQNHSHSEKLNKLAEAIIMDSNDEDDILIFLDGDAFPIADIIKFGRQKLKEVPLVAVRRKVEEGDMQPHPSFCMTTIGFWKFIQGSWDKGYKWKNNRGKHVTDVGGNLLGILKKKGVEWYPMDRTSSQKLHYLLFGVYENRIYHHGSGFRSPIFRKNLTQADRLNLAFQKYVLKLISPSIRNNIPKSLKSRLGLGVKVKDYDLELSDLVYNCISNDDNFISDYFNL